MRDAFGKALVKAGKSIKKIVVLDADVAHPTRAHYFKEEFPDRFFQIGVAESNMICIAAGLATLGFVPFAVSFAAFASRRAYDQVNMAVAYPCLNVKIVGAYAGLSSYSTGASHQSVNDIAIMRAIPNMIVVEPADAIQLEKLLLDISLHKGPCYFRIMRDDVPSIFSNDQKFSLGKGIVLKDGEDITLIGLGTMAVSCLDAASVLQRKGINARVISIHTVKPIDKELILKAAKETKAIVTVENHSIIGGLGSAVADLLVNNDPVRMSMVGIKDLFGRCGMPEDLLERYELTSSNIVENAIAVCQVNKRSCR
ncbi:MAG: transketolase family protein [Actinobacteria bacterium]|nr:transketolase family protein [Actinomycetota bacterium]